MSHTANKIGGLNVNFWTGQQKELLISLSLEFWRTCIITIISSRGQILTTRLQHVIIIVEYVYGTKGARSSNCINNQFPVSDLWQGLVSRHATMMLFNLGQEWFKASTQLINLHGNLADRMIYEIPWTGKTKINSILWDLYCTPFTEREGTVTSILFSNVKEPTTVNNTRNLVPIQATDNLTLILVPGGRLRMNPNWFWWWWMYDGETTIHHLNHSTGKWRCRYYHTLVDYWWSSRAVPISWLEAIFHALHLLRIGLQKRANTASMVGWFVLNK